MLKLNYRKRKGNETLIGTGTKAEAYINKSLIRIFNVKKYNNAFGFKLPISRM